MTEIRKKEGIRLNKYRRKYKAPKQRDLLEDVGVYGRIMLKLILKNYDG
jgi:hypothetical protein